MDYTNSMSLLRPRGKIQYTSLSLLLPPPTTSTTPHHYSGAVTSLCGLCSGVDREPERFTDWTGQWSGTQTQRRRQQSRAHESGPILKPPGF